MNKNEELTWQKYLEKQSKKVGRDLSRTAETDLPTGDPSPNQQEPRRNITIKRVYPVEVQNSATGATLRSPELERPAPRPSQPMSTPYVSVENIWKSAERIVKKKDAAEGEAARNASDAPLVRKRIDAGKTLDRERRVAAPESVPAKTGKSREELLERLLNPTITLEEAAQIMGVCKATARRYTEKGVLRCFRTAGNQRRFKLNDVLTFMENQKGED